MGGGVIREYHSFLGSFTMYRNHTYREIFGDDGGHSKDVGKSKGSGEEEEQPRLVLPHLLVVLGHEEGQATDHTPDLPGKGVLSFDCICPYCLFVNRSTT